MRITLDASLTAGEPCDLDVAAGATLAEVLECTHGRAVWCGAVLLDPQHRAGVWPLLNGALLTATPGPMTARPRGLHVAVVTGPDAGAVVPLARELTWGAAAGGLERSGTTLADDALDSLHLTLAPAEDGSVVVRDLGTVNGTVVRRQGRRGAGHGRRVGTARVREGDTVQAGRTTFELRGDAPVPRAPRRMPDPTDPGSWTRATAVDGPRAVGLMRAVVLARGRRPPGDPDWAEPWWEWLPPPLAGDEPLWLGRAPQGATGATTLIALRERTLVEDAAAREWHAPLQVSASMAECLARAIAAGGAEPDRAALRWADLPAITADQGTAAPWRVAVGAYAGPHDRPWVLDLDAPLPHLVAVGAGGSGKTTLLATAVGALARGHGPSELALVVLTARDGGELLPLRHLPHVLAFAEQVGAQDAERTLEEVVGGLATRNRARRLVVVADDVEAWGPAGRRSWSLCEAIAREGAASGVHLLLATSMPTAVLSPGLRAHAGTTVAFGCATESESVDLIGVADASSLPRDAPGRAVVRSGTGIHEVRVALPVADPTPKVRPWGAPAVAGRHLADVAALGPHIEEAGPAGPPL